MTQEDKEQFIQDVEILMNDAYDGAPIGNYELDLLERIRIGLKKL